MATIVMGRNAGPDYTRLVEAGAHVIVCMRDGEGGTMQVSYDDLDALSEMALLWAEARDKLAAAWVERYGQERSALSVKAGDRIVLPDTASTTGPIRGPLVEVTSVTIRSSGVIFQCDGEGGVAATVDFPKDATLTVVRTPAMRAVADLEHVGR